jgi:phosphatidylglycerol:prolipoprotein diacylglycerol transferase
VLEIRFPQIDPVALNLPGPLDVRWYGLGYLVGFTVGYLILRRLAERRFLRINPDAVGDLIFALVIGVILGGRLGYILFYDFGRVAANPLSALRIWEGGLSFHGGLLGAILAGLWFARKHGAGFLNVGDSLALGVCPGIFTVRVANFVNGELYGRVAGPDVPWAVRFPTDPVAWRLLGLDRAGSLQEREQVIQEAYRSGAWDQVRAQVPLRHPSQLYEALAEGLVLGVVLWIAYRWSARRGHPMGEGFFGGIFMLGYGLGRSLMELFRQPDAQFTGDGDRLGTVLGPLTMGQTLSLGMIAVGVFLLVRAARVRRRTPAV